eukprot:g5410.t1
MNAPMIYSICSASTTHNDFVEVLKTVKRAKVSSSSSSYCDFTNLTVAIENAPPNSGLAMLHSPEEAPLNLTSLPKVSIATAAKKNQRLYFEFAYQKEYTSTNLYKTTIFERVVVSPGKSVDLHLDPMRILTMHTQNYTAQNFTEISKNDKVTVDLVLTKVAGYDRALNFNNTVVYPLLYRTQEMQDCEMMVSASPLSRFITDRFAPTTAWSTTLNYIFNWLTKSHFNYNITFEAAVRPTFGRDEILPQDSERIAFARGIDWFFESGQFPSVEFSFQLAKMRANGPPNGPTPIKLPKNEVKNGTVNGIMGVLEGYQKTIVKDGYQLLSLQLRDDCITETSMALAFREKLSSKIPINKKVEALFETPSTTYGTVAKNLLNYAWINGNYIQRFVPGMKTEPWQTRGDARGDAMGLIGWSTTTASYQMYYTDDNGSANHFSSHSARGLLAGLATRSLLGDMRWDSVIASAVLANLRMAGNDGFAEGALSFAQVASNGGWEAQASKARNNTMRVYSPHYQSYIWAVWLRLYAVSKHQPLLDKAKNAITNMMVHYPSFWQATSNGITMQRARMILPLAWLVQVEDTPLHRQWLDTMISGLLARQDERTGAIQEEISAKGFGSSARVPNNANYGTFESPLNQSNDDPVSDLLYTTNFAFLGLHEAIYAVGGEKTEAGKRYTAANDKLAEVLVRCQVKSGDLHVEHWNHKELDGSWYRAFDFHKHDYWASDSDIGWGAWSIETGWSMAWITSVFAMRDLHTSLWDISSGSENAPGEKLGQELLQRVEMYSFRSNE